MINSAIDWINGFFEMIGHYLSVLSVWIGSNQAIVATILLPSLTLVVTNIVSTRNARVTAESNIRNQETQVAIKIGEMRQVWISGLRDDLAEFCALAPSAKALKAEQYQKLISLASKIQMRLNPAEINARELVQVMRRLHQKEMKEGEEPADVIDLVRLSQKVLKAEWDRLKRDLSERRAL